MKSAKVALEYLNMVRKRLKWFYVVVAVVASLLVLFGFRLYSLRSATAPALSETTAAQTQIQKVIVLAVNDMQNPISAELTTSIKQLVIDNENLRAVILDAQGLRSRQSEQLEQLDRSSIAGVILLPVANLDDLDGPISQLNQAGVPVISLNQPAMDSPLLTSHVTRIGYDTLEAGRQQAAFCARQLGGQGQVVILAGPEDQGVTQQMLSGVREVFRNFPGISIADIQFGGNDSHHCPK
jgi:ABC-type sugar transport system substrate-binding protein